MQYGGSIVTCVLPEQRVAHNRFPEESLCIPAAHAIVYGFRQISIEKMHVLPDFQENDRHSCILTDRNAFFCGNLQVFLQLP